MDMQELSILKTAILNEVEGEKYYRQTAAKTDDQEIAQSFLALAADEGQHQRMLRSLLDDLMQGSATGFDLSQWPEAQSPHIFSGPNAPPGLAEMEISVYHIAILLEKASIDFYHQAAKRTQSAAAQKLYDLLADWERQHLHAMEAIYDRLSEDWWDQQHFSPA
jgi:rubrerythrin